MGAVVTGAVVEVIGPLTQRRFERMALPRDDWQSPSIQDMRGDFLSVRVWSFFLQGTDLVAEICCHPTDETVRIHLRLAIIASFFGMLVASSAHSSEHVIGKRKENVPVPSKFFCLRP